MRTSRSGAKRDGGREKILSRLCAISAELLVGLDSSNHEIMTGAEIKSWMFNQLSHPGALRSIILDNNVSVSLYVKGKFIVWQI